MASGAFASYCLRVPDHNVFHFADAATGLRRLAEDRADVNAGSRLPATLTTSDITSATASLTEGQWVLNVDVTDRAAKRIQAFSEQHVGRMLAFLVDGQVHSTPRILDPITGKGFLIGRFDEANAERLASAINKGCKR